MHYYTDITNSMDMNLSKTLGHGGGEVSLASCSPWDRRVRHDLATEEQQLIQMRLKFKQ